MAGRVGRLVALALLVVVVGGVRLQRPRRLVEVAAEPTGVMGTACRLIAVAPTAALARRGVVEAEAALRRVEALMSNWRPDSDTSRLNAAPVGQSIELAAETATVIQAAEVVRRASDGAFDVACLPLLERWRQAAEDGLPPPPEELARLTRAAGEPFRFELLANPPRATRLTPLARLDLGGIAKGYGLDQALAALRREGCRGGLVEVGGDVRCFGVRADGALWRLGVQDPWSEGALGALAVTDRAVCTSGTYRRWVTIADRRYGHVIDPRTGQPVANVPSVTVVAPDGLFADAWATALMVLGPAGLTRLPEAVEALLIDTGDGAAELWRTAGFHRFEVAPVTLPPTAPTSPRQVPK